MSAPVPFVVSAPRSGSTLLRMMLDSHPQLAIPPETGFTGVLATAAGSFAPTMPRAEFMAIITGTPPEAPTWQDLSIDVNEISAALPADVNIADGLRHVYATYAHRQGKPRWGDKTPGHGPVIDRIATLLPEAVAIHIVRDVRDVVVSWSEASFAPTTDVLTLAGYWNTHVAATRTALANTPNHLEVRYERLVHDPSAVLAEVCAAVDLRFTAAERDAMLAYWQRSPQRLIEHGDRVDGDGKVVIARADRLRQQRWVTQPPNVERIGRWRDVISPEVAAAVLAAAPQARP